MGTIETRYRRLFEAVNDSIFLGTITPDGLPGKFIEVTDCACAQLGYTREELLQKSPRDIDPHFDPAQLGGLVSQLLAQKEIRFQTEHQAKDGRRIPVEISSRLFEEDGQTMVLSVVRDLTERKAAEAALLSQQEKWQALFEYAPDACYLHDLSGTFVEGNRAAEDLIGYDRGELIGRSLLQLNLLNREELIRAAALLARNAQGEPTGPDELVLRRKDGSTRTVETRTYPVEVEGKRLVLGIARDISVRKQVEEALRESEERFRTIIENSAAGYFFIDCEGCFQSVNDTWLRLHKYESADEIIGRHFSVTQVEEDQQCAKEIVVRSLNGERIASGEFRRRCKDGSVGWHTFSLGPVRRSGAIVALEGFLIDITEHKKTEQDYRTLFREMLDGFALHEILCDTDGRPVDYRFLAVNPAFERLTGLKAESLLDRTVLEVMPGIERRWIETYGQVAVTGRPIFFEDYVAELGKHFKVTAFRPAPNQFACIFADITERKRAEEGLRESEQRFRCYFELGLVGMAITSIEKGWVQFNDRLCQIVGYSPEELARKTWADLTHPDDLARDQAEFNRVLRGEIDAYALEKRFVHQDGSVVHTEISVRCVRRADGSPDYFLGMVHDITERKQREQALRESKQRLDLATSSAKLGIWDWDVVNNRMTWDEQMFRLYGLAERPAHFGVEIWERGVDPEDKAKAGEACQAALRGEEDYDVEFKVRHPNGTVRHIHAKGLVLRDKDGKAIRMLGINYDITERKLLEEQLRQAQKLEAVGRLAGGVAHDFNNILAATMLHLGLLKQNEKLDQEVQQSLDELIDGTERAASLTRQLLLFSRRSVLETKTLDLNDVITNLLKMLKRLIGEDIDLQFSPNVKLLPVEADPGMIEQMLMNLCVNARDAMPKGGRLTITLQSIDVDQSQPRNHPSGRPGAFVCVSVVDTGCGMDEATMERIFEPFFTTKPPGEGTGLGLATVHGIVGQHKGWVEVQSKVGQGSTFLVFLPASARKAAASTRAVQQQPMQGHETIMLVEDERSLRKVTARGLQQLGYKVMEAADGKEALKVWNEHPGEIDLLLSDMVMPEGMTGLDLAEKLRELKSSLKVIIASGYSAEMLTQGIPESKQIVRLQKPYSLEALSKVIRQCLDSE